MQNNNSKKIRSNLITKMVKLLSLTAVLSLSCKRLVDRGSIEWR